MTPDTYRQPIRGFRILERLGSGAMGSVYRAQQTALGREVALKVVRRDAVSPSSLERFRKEARLLAQLNHPNVVRVFEMGEDGVYLFLAMEIVLGRSLKDLMAERHRLPEATVLAIGEKVARGLAHASAEGIVHRDIKPGNILVGQKGVVKLSDFGLAMVGEERSLTRSGQTVGTPQYMAPEQTRHSRKVDVRSDLFSLGATLYHALTGVPPFRGESVAEVLTSLLFDVPEKPEEIVPGINPGTSRILAKLLAKRPGRRYSTPDELVSDLVLLRADAEGTLDAGRNLGIDWSESGIAQKPWYRRLESIALAGALTVGIVLSAMLLFREKPRNTLQTNEKDPTSLQLESWRRALSEGQDPLSVYRQVSGARSSGTLDSRVATPLLETCLERAYSVRDGLLINASDRAREAFFAGEPKRAQKTLDQGLGDVLSGDLPSELLERLTTQASRHKTRWSEILREFDNRLESAFSNRMASLSGASSLTPFPLDVDWGEDIDGKRGPDLIRIASWNRLLEDDAESLEARWDQRLNSLSSDAEMAQFEFSQGLERDVKKRLDTVVERWSDEGPGGESSQETLEVLVGESLPGFGKTLADLGSHSAQFDVFLNECVAHLEEAALAYKAKIREARQTEVLSIVIPLLESRDYATTFEVLRNRSSELEALFVDAWTGRTARLKTLRQQAIDGLASKEGENVTLDSHWTGVLERVRKSDGRITLSTLREPISLDQLSPLTCLSLAEFQQTLDPLSKAEWLYFGGEIEAAHQGLGSVPDSADKRWLSQVIQERIVGRRVEVEQAKQELIAMTAKAEGALRLGQKSEALDQYEKLVAHEWLRNSRLYERLPVELRRRTELKSTIANLKSALEDEDERSQLSDLFRGQIKVDQDRRVTVTYGFESDTEIEDFSVGRNYLIEDGGLKSSRPNPHSDLYRTSGGPSLEVALDAKKPFAIRLVMKTEWEDGTPQFFGIRIMGLCFGVKSTNDPAVDAQANYWFESLDAWEDHFTHHLLDRSRPKLSSHPISAVASLRRGGTYTIEIHYDPQSKSALFQVDDVIYYRLSKVDRGSLESALGLEFRSSVPATFEELSVSGYLDARWLRERREH